MKIDHPTPGQIPQLRQLWQEAFGDTDAFLDIFYETAYAPERCMCVTVDGAVAAAAYWFSCGQYAYIYAVATAKQHQGKGLCHALMGKIHADLLQQGFSGAILVPGDEGLRRFYGGMGYENFGGIRNFSQEAGAPVALRKLNATEFATLRRQYLPAGGVVQEGENLAFLSQWAEFYAGNDFLLTATRDGDTLRGLELLGNANAASGILAALGAKRGHFRAPGSEPFAMCRPLTQENPPTYFGFAFD